MDLRLQMWNCYCKFSVFIQNPLLSLPSVFLFPSQSLGPSVFPHKSTRQGEWVAMRLPSRGHRWLTLESPETRLFTVTGEAEVATTLVPPVSLDLEMKTKVPELHLKHGQGQGSLSWGVWEVWSLFQGSSPEHWGRGTSELHIPSLLTTLWTRQTRDSELYIHILVMNVYIYAKWLFTSTLPYFSYVDIKIGTWEMTVFRIHSWVLELNVTNKNEKKTVECDKYFADNFL